MFGGGHENERRPGTENVAAIAGFVDALERFVPAPVFSTPDTLSLSSRLWKSVSRIEGLEPRGPSEGRLPNTVSFTVSGCDSLSLLAALDLEGICASSGSACSSGSLNPSHVLLAMGVRPDLATSFVRFSLGRYSSLDEVEFVESLLPSLIARLRLC
jgi:cysteine desulfurase